MPFYSDFKTSNGNWITLKPLNFFDREELIERFNSLNKFSKISTLVLDENSEDYYNIEKILSLYNLELLDFNVEDLESLIKDHIIPLNFSELSKPSTKSYVRKPKKQKTLTKEENIAQVFSNIWGLCESAAEALMLLEQMPAEIFLKAAEFRSEDLKRIYSTEEERRKDQMRSMRNEMVEKAKKQQAEAAKKSA